MILLLSGVKWILLAMSVSALFLFVDFSSSTIQDYWKIEEKVPVKEKMKKIIIPIILRGICVVVLVVFTARHTIYTYKAENHEFKDVTYKVENTEVLYTVHIKSFIKEKGKEGIYQITLNADSTKYLMELISMFTSENYLFSEKLHYANEDFSRIELFLTESEYEELIGTGNTHFRMTVSTLSLKTETFYHVNHKASFYRLGCFSEPFTDDSVQMISDTFLETVNGTDFEFAYDGSIADYAEKGLFTAAEE